MFAMLARWLHVPSHTPSCPTVVELSAAGGPMDARPILVGRHEGQAWARRVGLNRLPQNAPVVLRRAPEVCAVSSSFWMGALAPRIRAAGSIEAFRARHVLELNAHDQDAVLLCVQRVLIERSFRPDRPRWRSRWA